ncbi:gliding motility-associated C-terminal domain-containing protein [Labilibaculum sp. K2S]|uniref:gliding motility-associated C-terminal domain-containing protein n=1 Tax=Labilibaculum sp. K2S TaxID=3056386 RepID=UPI0025A3C335|nr:gliding motility-associated C-terminal domain-containing protein [Labilibaculum sp. K2S]MDM8158932.1 gliding motility-associated C-terminal domain-containing protein [Labilibaculum sp. K2S]
MTIFRCALLVIFAVLSNPIFSQITAPTASYSSATHYTSPPQDDIFVFCDNIGAGVGELKAVSNDGTSGWTFTWMKWDSGAADFTIPVIIENNQSESVLTNLSDGLYRVVVEKGLETFEDQAWVLNNANANPSLTLILMDCVGLHFVASFLPVDLKYNDIRSGNPNDLKSVLDETTDRVVKFSMLRNSEVILSAAESLGVLPYLQTNKSFIDLEAFEGERPYVVVVQDQYNCVFESVTIMTSTDKVKAEFSVDPMAGEAPLEVAFDNKSVNADDFEWFLYQDFDRIANATTVEDSLLVDGIITDEGPIDYTYLHPGNYFVKLIASSENVDGTCIDEFNFKKEGTPIVVDTSLVQVPNVFTPNGDGRNDIFRVKSQSLKSFSATIINRWGRVVYEWKDPEGGWNGKVNGKWATPGTYFYVITATGREEQKKKYTKKGSFMLIRK